MTTFNGKPALTIAERKEIETTIRSLIPFIRTVEVSIFGEVYIFGEVWSISEIRQFLTFAKSLGLKVWREASAWYSESDTVITDIVAAYAVSVEYTIL